MRCITCKRTVESGCNIFEEFGEEQITVKDDLEEILGSEVCKQFFIFRESPY